MAKKTDPEIHLDGKQERFWCERCQKSAATDRQWLQCDTCGDQMISMREKVRRIAKGK